MSRTAFNGMDLRPWDGRQHFPRLLTHILDPEVAGHVVGDLAQFH